MVGKVRVSISEQEAEKEIIITKIKSGSPVTSSSTESVNNASIVANNKLINDAKTGLNKKLADAKKAKNISLQKSIQAQIDAINDENKNIARINTLNKQLTAAYKVKAYIELKKVIDTKTTEYAKLTGVDNSTLNSLLAQKAKRDSITQCQIDFTNWWKQYKSDHFDQSFNFISVNFIPKAYAQTNKDPAKAKAEAEKAKAEAEKAKQKLKDKGNKAKEKLGKALSALGKLAEAVPQFTVGVCANLVEQV